MAMGNTPKKKKRMESPPHRGGGGSGGSEAACHRPRSTGRAERRPSARGMSVGQVIRFIACGKFREFFCVLMSGF